MTDESGELAARYDYSAYGEIVFESEPIAQAVPNARTYTGHRLDRETGLLYMGARYYDPTLARFSAPDPIVSDLFSSQALNRYSYVFSSPTLFVDPTGMEGFEAADLLRDIYTYDASLSAPSVGGAAALEHLSDVLDQTGALESDRNLCEFEPQGCQWHDAGPGNSGGTNLTGTVTRTPQTQNLVDAKVGPESTNERTDASINEIAGAIAVLTTTGQITAETATPLLDILEGLKTDSLSGGIGQAVGLGASVGFRSLETLAVAGVIESHGRYVSGQSIIVTTAFGVGQDAVAAALGTAVAGATCASTARRARWLLSALRVLQVPVCPIYRRAQLIFLYF